MKRITSFLLCFAMIFTLLPGVAMASGEGVAIYDEDGETDYIELPQNGRVTLYADSDTGDCQWQIKVTDDIWVNISDETDDEITLSYAMVANLLDGDRAYVRCVGGEDVVSDEVVVEITDPVFEEGEVVVYSTREASEAASAAESGIEPAAEGVTYSVVINYVFEDGGVAAPVWSASLAEGSNYTATITSPTVLGYAPKEDDEEIEVNIENIQEDVTYDVIYYPALVEYTVVHYQQNLNDDGYTVADNETKTGYTKDPVGKDLEKKTYAGFYSLLYDTTTEIAADGSTEVEIYYDRYYYLMTFDLAGGYGVEPIYARYGAPISVGTPTKAGYTFSGWSPELTYTTMPAENTSFTATWTAGDTTYDVVFWYENADDTNYSQAGVLEDVSAVAGSVVDGSTYADTAFTGRDAEHFTYSHADEDVIVAGDGSTVVNVYFSRNVYTLTFVAQGVCVLEDHDHNNCTLTCTLTEHEHSSECCDNDDIGHIIHGYNCNSNICHYGYEHSHSGSCYSCGKAEHTHTNNCTNANSENIVKVIIAKYDSDITSVWEAQPIKGYLDDGYVFQSNVTEDYYSFLEKMPGQNLTLTQSSFNGSYKYTWYYYLEVLPGQSTDGLTTRTDAGKTYYLYHTSSVTGENVNLTYAEDYFPITGFTQRDNRVPSFDNRIAYLYYLRNSYNLTFSNYGDTVEGHGGSYLYEADISGTYFVPEYPEELEAGAYVFDGWYESPFFGDTKFEFTTEDEEGNTVNATMPASDVMLYANWVPKNHYVNIYLTSEMSADEQIGTTQTVPHRGLATEPTELTNGSYTFVGWFYMDGETEKAFDFSMPVTKDLNLYAKWSSNKLVEYTLKYVYVDGNGDQIPIAEETTGSGLAGTTKTFEAKAGTDLYDGYQSGYFPETNSHSLTLDLEDSNNNVYVFEYVKMPEVQYIVQYLEVGTGKILVTQKEAKTSDAVITETFVPVTSYMPDAYSKRLVLSANAEENVIIFWYTVDTEHAPVQIIHYTQNAEGDGYTIYQETTDLNGEIDQLYSTDILTIDGYWYDHATANGDAVTETNGKVTGTVIASGLVLALYYNRDQYPYEFKFLEQGTDKVLAESVKGTARYGSQVTGNAKTIDGYTCVSDESQSMIIKKEDDSITAVNNVRIFYYTEQEVTINYVPVGPNSANDGSGSVDPTFETIKVITGTAAGSTPTASEGFRFVGWYENEACTDLVDAEDGTVDAATSKFTPAKVNGKYQEVTYYAKFEYNLTSLTITKTVSGTYYDGESFIFNVTGDDLESPITVVINGEGSVTIDGLTVGQTYTVTEDTSWSYRYTASCNKPNGEITLSSTVDKNKIAFTNTKSADDKWLDGNAYKKNVFAAISAALAEIWDNNNG